MAYTKDSPGRGADATERPADSWQLVAAVQAGDSEAFELLYRSYARSVYAYLLTCTKDKGLAEDLTSETFLRTFQRIHSLVDRGHNFRAWLMTVARNLVRDHQRSAWHRRELTVASFHDEVHAMPDVSVEVMRRAESADLWRSVQQLPEAQRECLTLRFGDELSVAETSSRMRKEAVAVRALQYRAVRSLAKTLDIPEAS